LISLAVGGIVNESLDVHQIDQRSSLKWPNWCWNNLNEEEERDYINFYYYQRSLCGCAKAKEHEDYDEMNNLIFYETIICT